MGVNTPKCLLAGEVGDVTKSYFFEYESMSKMLVLCIVLGYPVHYVLEFVLCAPFDKGLFTNFVVARYKGSFVSIGYENGFVIFTKSGFSWVLSTNNLKASGPNWAAFLGLVKSLTFNLPFVSILFSNLLSFIILGDVTLRYRCSLNLR